MTKMLMILAVVACNVDVPSPDDGTKYSCTGTLKCYADRYTAVSVVGCADSINEAVHFFDDFINKASSDPRCGDDYVFWVSCRDTGEYCLAE